MEENIDFFQPVYTQYNERKYALFKNSISNNLKF